MLPARDFMFYDSVRCLVVDPGAGKRRGIPGGVQGKGSLIIV